MLTELIIEDDYPQLCCGDTSPFTSGISSDGAVTHHVACRSEDELTPTIIFDNKTEKSILEKIENNREELAEEIRQSMFIFEDLFHLDDRSVRALLKEVSNDELILALKTASENLSEKIFSNVSQRAAQMMREDMEVMGPVKLRDVEQAQQNILKTARRLEEEGKIVLAGKGGEDVLV